MSHCRKGPAKRGATRLPKSIPTLGHQRHGTSRTADRPSLPPSPKRNQHRLYRFLRALPVPLTLKVVVAARREDKLEEVVVEIEAAGGEALLVVGDVSKVCVACLLGAANTSLVEHGLTASLGKQGLKGMFR